MNPQFDQIFLSGIFNSVLKIMFVLAGLIYLVFAVIVIRQIYTMQQSLVTSFSNRLRLISYLHLGLAILVSSFFLFGL